MFHSIAAKKSQESIFRSILKNLYDHYKAHPPVKSNSQYYEFLKNDLTHWTKTLQKCTDQELFILMSVLTHDISLLDLSDAMQIREAKVRYLLNQSIRKVIKTFNINFENKKEVKLKEYGQQDVTSLFISEHFAEYCLGLSTGEVTRKIEASKKEIAKYDQIKYEIYNFKNELKNLKCSEFFYEELKILESRNEPKSKNKEAFFRYKDKIGLVTFILIFCVLLIVRPSFLKFENLTGSNKKIILEEVSLKKDDLSQKEPVLSHLENTDSVSSTLAELKTTQTTEKPTVEFDKKISFNNTLVVSNVTAAIAQKDNKKTKPVNVELSNSGVYKGEMTVSDWEIVSKVIKDKIIEIGGTKAGEVELGWIKNKKTSYYHFIFPADKFENLIATFKQYGVVSYKFEQHPRKITNGQKRFILEVHQGE